MFAARDRKSFKTEPGQVNVYSGLKYPHRLNLYASPCSNYASLMPTSYDRPPLDDVTIEDFEEFALDRLRVLAEIESSFVRNRPYDDLKTVTLAQCKKYLPLDHNSAKLVDRDEQRRKDHVGHFVLRLAFCRSCVACVFSTCLTLTARV